MRRLLREPLLHFLLLGAAIFAIYDLVPRPVGGESGRIVVTEGQIEAMVTNFTRTWQRPPTTEELQGLIRERVREEVYCREAIALGLDKDDPIIRHRLRQKLEFVTEDVAASVEPTDDDLNAYLKAHADVFRLQPEFTFRQVYLNPERHGEHLASDVSRLLSQLKRAGDKANTSALGDAFLLEHEYRAASATDVARAFGEKFATALALLPPGQWQGPVESGYGVHLVFVREITPGRVPALSEVRESVRREWANARRTETNEKFYHELLKRYAVTIELGQSGEARKKLTAERR